MSQVEVIRAVSLGGLPHGFLGRRGGISTGELAGLRGSGGFEGWFGEGSCGTLEHWFE